MTGEGQKIKVNREIETIQEKVWRQETHERQYGQETEEKCKRGEKYKRNTRARQSRRDLRHQVKIQA